MTTPRIRAPLQARSRSSYERLLDAAERLLRDHPFEAITIAQIVDEADSSVGSFYARFADKNAILVALYLRYDERLEEDHRDTVPDSGSLEDVALRVCRRLVGIYRERLWFMRAIALHARSNPEAIDEGVRGRRSRLHRRLAESFVRFGAESGSDATVRAAEWGLFVVAATAREKILFGEAPHAASLRVTDEELTAELARTLVAYMRSKVSLVEP